MKRQAIKNLLLFTVLIGGTAISRAAESDSLGNIGDNLDLHAVLETFKTAESIEDFENTINSSSSKINNLDLNEDGQTDYIQIIDNVEGDAHALIFRVDLSESESQDIAAIELEKIGDQNATIQIVGDEEIYGADYIIEPTGTVATGNMPPAFVVVNVWHWSSVRFIYGATYRPWRSPYKWGNYPKTWKPWKPYRWATYNSFHKQHHKHYHLVHVHRVNNAHNIYRKHRKTSKHIKNHKHHHGNKHVNNHKKAHKKNNKKNHKKHKKSHKH